MFQFPELPPLSYVFTQQYHDITHGGFPHSDIPGSKPACGSPRLFAAYHVLLRLLVPRHPPYALIRLTYYNLAIRTLWFFRLPLFLMFHNFHYDVFSIFIYVVFNVQYRQNFVLSETTSLVCIEDAVLLKMDFHRKFIEYFSSTYSI